MVIFGANGDLTKRLVVPALYNLSKSGLLPPHFALVGVDHNAKTAETWRSDLHGFLEQIGGSGPEGKIDQESWDRLGSAMSYVQGDFTDPATFQKLRTRLDELNTTNELDGNVLFYLATSDHFFGPLVDALAQADLVTSDKGWRRVVIEKPFGHDLESARALNVRILKSLREDQIYRIDHFLGKETVQNIMALRFANGLFEPIWNRNFIDHVQIDVPETLGLGKRAGFYEQTGAYRDMVVTHLFQIVAFMAMEPPTALAPGPISEEKNKVFRSMVPIDPKDVVRGQYGGYRSEEGVDPASETETFVALKCMIDNWRWAGVPFFLRTGKKLAEGQRIISIAFREPPKSMFPAGSGVGAEGPDHLTFDLADASKMSLSFYGKRPGPGMRLDKLSLQFAMHETGLIGDVLEAYERLILDAMRGDHTLFTTAEGIERLWEVSKPLLEMPPPVRAYPSGSWGPKSIHQLVAPNAWRLPFERGWRDPNPTGG
jgi:glucose-6-phosphate 1-dehydrogenase